MTDRDLQDELIHALADAGFRASPRWLSRDLAAPERVERFARFLARNFYRNRVIHFFKYSRALAHVTGRMPEAVISEPGFDALLPGMVLGSRDTARSVVDLVLVQQREASGSAKVSYLEELLRYQAAMMVAEAGPRDWNGDGGRPPAEVAVAEVVDGTTVLELEHDLPQVLAELRRPVEDVPPVPRRAIRLLVARSRQGRVSVAEINEQMARILHLADGTRSLADLLEASGSTGDPVRELIELGAIRASSGS
ncbi:MAG: hypothetical protein ACRDHM_05630 [Actinomycetota bacterium]